MIEYPATPRTCSTKAVLWRWSLVLGKKGGSQRDVFGVEISYTPMDLLKVLKKVNKQKAHSRKLTLQWTTSFSIGNTSSKTLICHCHVTFPGVVQPNRKPWLLQFLHQNKIDPTKRNRKEVMFIPCQR